MSNWYLQNGKDSDIVISSRVRLARNLEKYPFLTKCSKEQSIEILENAKQIANSIGYGLKFMNLNDIDNITWKLFINSLKKQNRYDRNV